MKRDHDLIREILFAIEAHEEPTLWGQPEVAGASNKDLIYHLDQMQLSGLIAVSQIPNPNTSFGYEIGEIRMLPKGHDMLDAVRDPKIWRLTKEGAGKAGGYTLELLVKLAKGYAKKQIEERTGIVLEG